MRRPRADIPPAILAALALAPAAAGCGAASEVPVAAAAQAVEALAVEPAEEAPAEAAPAEAAPAIGSFGLTYYWVTSEGRGERTTPLYGRGCRQIAEVTESFARRLAMQGTGRLRDGRLVNVAGPCDCPSSRCYYFPSQRKRWGAGVAKRPLSPFRSVAVDPELVSIGDTLYIEELDGLLMPGEAPWGGFVHNGCVVADDRGGGIKGQRIDFFTGRQGYYRALFERHGLSEVTVYPGAGRCDGVAESGDETPQRTARRSSS